MQYNYLTYGNLISSLGNSIDSNWNALINGKTGIKKSCTFSNKNWPIGVIKSLNEPNRFEQLFKLTLQNLKNNDAALFDSEDTIFIISSSKGNLANNPSDPFHLVSKILLEEYAIKNEPIIISNACISGVLAINLADNLIKSSSYNQAIVIGIDVLSEFIINGFQALFALSDEVSRPFDSTRKGINLGEAAASVIVSNKPLNNTFNAKVLGGSSSNDANHISGPSRTGEGLLRSIQKTIKFADIDTQEIDFISAHGTATLYNDEMESIALDRAGLNSPPLNSYKAYLGHTLGAAGVVEVVLALKSMQHNFLIQSMGFRKLGVSKNLNIITKNKKNQINTLLKIASGFGGGNASIILKKNFD